MRHLNVVLIGCSEDVSPHVRREILNRGDKAEAEFPDARRAADGLRLSQEKAESSLFKWEVPRARNRSAI